ncbi:hypothetical protein Tco_0210529 [Tanacetum coccineum]
MLEDLGPDRGQDASPAIRSALHAGFMKCNPITFHGTEGAVELRRWFEKTESVFGISECAEGKKINAAEELKLAQKKRVIQVKAVEKTAAV